MDPAALEAPLSPQNSTTVRTTENRSERVARAASAFFTPGRNERGVRPWTVEGVTAHPLRLSLNGQTLSAWRFGDSARRVALAHGWGSYSGRLKALIRPLVEAGFEVVAVDFPAHGASTGIQTTLPEWAESLALLAAEVGGLTGIVGHSLGGAAAVLAHSQGLRLERLALLAAPSHPRPFVLRIAQAHGLSEVETAQMQRLVEARVGAPLDAFHQPPRSKALTAQALVMHDPNDDAVPFTHAQELTAAFSQSSLVPLAGLGHDGMLRDAQTHARILRFLEGASPSPAPSAPSPFGGTP